MDPSSKKRKAEENGTAGAAEASPSKLIPAEARKIIESFSQEQLIDIVSDAMCRDLGVLSTVRSVADRDPAQRKLFIRGLGWETTTEGLRSLFSQYGDLEEAVVIVDKATGRSKGYGFITFRHIDGALLALREPSKKIDGRMTVTQLAAAGAQGPTAPAPLAIDVAQRKIYVGNVPPDMPPDRLLVHFSSYGEIEEGPLGFDKQTGKSRGYALFVYKTAEAARSSLVDPTKTIDGHHLVCKLAADGKKGKLGGMPEPALNQVPVAGGGNAPGDGLGLGQQSSLPGGPLSSQYGGPGGLSSFSGYSGSGMPGAAAAGLSHHHHLNSPLQSSIGMGTPGLGTPGLSTVGSQVPSSLGGAGAGGYGGGLSSGPYGSSSQYGSGGSGGYGGLGMGSSMYRVQPNSGGLPSGGYPESGRHYSLSSGAYQSQHHHPSGSPPPPGPRVPGGGGMYPNIPSYY